jgi:hypothetical protein
VDLCAALGVCADSCADCSRWQRHVAPAALLLARAHQLLWCDHFTCVLPCVRSGRGRLRRCMTCISACILPPRPLLTFYFFSSATFLFPQVMALSPYGAHPPSTTLPQSITFSSSHFSATNYPPTPSPSLLLPPPFPSLLFIIFPGAPSHHLSYLSFTSTASAQRYVLCTVARYLLLPPLPLLMASRLRRCSCGTGPALVFCSPCSRQQRYTVFQCRPWTRP